MSATQDLLPDDVEPGTYEARRHTVPKLAEALPPELIREQANESFRFFCDIATYNWIEGNERANWDGKPFDWFPAPPHFWDWYQRIQANAANMFLGARKHTKTTFSDCLMIWKSEYVPGHASLYWANTRDQVKDRMEEMDEIIDANPWLENVHTDTALLSKGFHNGSKVDTTWVTGGYEGGHVDLQLGDDPMKELGDIADSEVEHWYGNVIVPTLNPGNTLQAVIGTRKRPNDLYEILRRRHETEDFDDSIPGYNLVEYPAIREAWQQEYDRPGDLAPKALYSKRNAPRLAKHLNLPSEDIHILWPQARDEDFLVRNLGMQGRSYFLREYCMVYTQVEDAVVHRTWIDSTSQERAPPTRLGDPWQPADYGERRDPENPGKYIDTVTREDFDRVVVGHDPAGKGRDHFAFVTVGELTHRPEDLPDEYRALAIDEDGNPRPVVLRHVLDAWQAVDVPPSRWRDKLTALHDRYHPDTIGIESNLNQTWVMDDDEIPRRVQQTIEPIATGRGKHSWKEGVPSIGSDLEAGTYRFYTGGGDDNMTDKLITALTSLQRKDGELIGHTPDLVMALWMADRALANDGGAGSSRGNLKARGESETDRETRRQLKNSELGRAILNQYSHTNDRGL